MNDFDDFPEPEEEERPSKGQMKRDSTALQALGERLVGLRAEQLAAIPLPENLRDAIDEARRITAHGGLRRQLQYIGKLMRNVDAEPIRAALARLDEGSAWEKAQLHKSEKWRDRLIEEGDEALSALLVEYPGADSQQLRQLARQARTEREQGRPPHAARLLFRALRELFGSRREDQERL